MSAAASIRLTRGYAEIPNSIIEHQAVFTRAELALALIVLRRGGAGSTAVTVSDRNWQGWTGLSPRLKEYAIAGLKVKCLNVAGRGETARYSFQPDTWETFVRSADRSRPHTAGRRAGVSPKRDAKVHPDCRERGCALLVAGPCVVEKNGVEKSVDSKENSVSPSAPVQIAQPVAHRPPADAGKTGGLEAVFAATLATLRGIFPLIGVAFLVRLLATVRAAFADVQDAELAEAITTAYRMKRTRQKSEGLFLFTVPEALAQLRRRPPPTPVAYADFSDGVKNLLTRVLDAVRARGAPFERLAASVEFLRVQCSGSGVELEWVETEMERLEAHMIELAAKALQGSESATAVAACVEAELNRASQMTADQRERLADLVRSRETLKVLGLPRLSLLDV